MRARRRSPGAARQTRPAGTAPEYPTGDASPSPTGVGTASAIKLYDAQSTTLKATEGTIEGVSGLLHGQGGRDQEAQRADAVRTGSGRRLQRDADRHRRMGQPRHELYGRKDARLQRTRQLAQRAGARIPDLRDDGHLHRRRGHSLCDQALRRPEHDAQSQGRRHRGRHVGLVHRQGGRTGTPCLGTRRSERRQTRSRDLPLCLHHDQHRRQQKIQGPRQRRPTDTATSSATSAPPPRRRSKRQAAKARSPTPPASASPTSGLAESSTIFEYTSPASGTSEAVLKLKIEEGTAYTEAEAHVKY